MHGRSSRLPLAHRQLVRLPRNRPHDNLKGGRGPATSLSRNT